MSGPSFRPGQRAQAAIEYLVAYTACILVMIIALVLLYAFVVLPANIIGNNCQFSSTLGCFDSILGTNVLTSNTAMALYLFNAQSYSITSPNVIVQIGSVNSSSTQCQPNYVRPGGTILCTVKLSQKTSVNQLLIGKIYIIANACSTTTIRNCTGAQRQTYIGTFSGHTQAIRTYTPSITLDAESNTLPPDGQKDNLTAQVYLLGYPIRGATINFTANNTVPILGGQICGPNPVATQICSSFSNANPQGQANTTLWSYANVVVKVYANFSGASANVIIVFGKATTPQQKSCTLSGPIKTYVVTNSNHTNSRYSPISASGSSATYIVYKNDTFPLTISQQGNNQAGCFDVDTTVGGGQLSLTSSGNNGNMIINMKGDANVIISDQGNNPNFQLNDAGNGAITAINPGISGNNAHFTLSSGTGNVILTIQGNNAAVSNITTQSSNMIFTISGNNQVVNITDTATTANVVINDQGNNQVTNTSVTSGTTIVVPIASGNNNVFNSIGGTVIFTSIQGNNNVFNLRNEAVYVKSCGGNGNKVNLLGTSYYLPNSPYKGGGGC